jgi:prepilin-type N-terminal cleavage/methylation domain-containing protein
MDARRGKGREMRDDRAIWRIAGFTLIELLVSMTLTGLLALAIILGYRVAYNAWSKGETSMKEIRGRYAASELLTRQIGCMVPYYSRQKANDAPLDILLFDGQKTKLCFVSTFSAEYRQSGGDRLVEYFLGATANNQGNTLWVQESLLPNDQALEGLLFSSISKDKDGNYQVEYLEPQKKEKAIPLFTNIKTLEFEYLDRVFPSNQKGQAPQEAKKKKMLPAGIKIKFEWLEEGPFREKETLMVIPINAYYEKKPV